MLFVTLIRSSLRYFVAHCFASIFTSSCPTAPQRETRSPATAAEIFHDSDPEKQCSLNTRKGMSTNAKTKQKKHRSFIILVPFIYGKRAGTYVQYSLVALTASKLPRDSNADSASSNSSLPGSACGAWGGHGANSWQTALSWYERILCKPLTMHTQVCCKLQAIVLSNLQHLLDFCVTDHCPGFWGLCEGPSNQFNPIQGMQRH